MGIFDRFKRTQEPSPPPGPETPPRVPEPLPAPVPGPPPGPVASDATPADLVIFGSGEGKVLVTRQDLENRSFTQIQSGVFWEGESIPASEAAAAIVGLTVEDLLGPAWMSFGASLDRASEQIRRGDPHELRARLDERQVKVRATVEAALAESPVASQSLERLRSVAADFHPNLIRYVEPDEPCLLAWVQSRDVVYAAIADGSPVPVHWHYDSAEAAKRGDGVLHKTRVAEEAALVQLSFGNGILLDPDRVQPTEVTGTKGSRWIDPVSSENWATPEFASQAGRLIESTPALSPDTNFVLVGGPAVAVLHTNTIEVEHTGLATEVDDWILADRMVESSDWYENAVRIGDGLLAADSFGLLWRCPRVAGPVLKVARRITGVKCRELKFSFHEETGRDVDHDMVFPDEHWAWTRSYFTPPTQKLPSGGGWSPGRSEVFSVRPDVLVVGLVAHTARYAEMINACQPKWVIAPDVPFMRDFAERFVAGNQFEAREREGLRMLSYKWKRVERGAISQSNFGATWTSLPGVDARLLDSAVDYVRSAATPDVEPLQLLADPLLASVVEDSIRPLKALELDERARDVEEAKLAEYRSAWKARGSCLFYESASI